LWAATLTFPLLTQWVVAPPVLPPGAFDGPPVIGGLLFIAISGCLFVAVGILASSLTRSQLVAATLTFSILFIVILGIPAINTQVSVLVDDTAGLFAYVEIFGHLESFSRGVVDTRPLLFYLSNSVALLGLATLVVESRA
jgi:ABC-2 type transport system permease protein